jgi:hypothetical protein
MKREGKAAGSRVAAAHVGCCVCCVLCFVVVFCMGEQLVATILVESQHQPRQNGPFLRTHITKSALKHPKYNWMCKLVIIQRCCTRFDFLLAKLFGRSYECAKKSLKFAKIS